MLPISFGQAQSPPRTPRPSDPLRFLGCRGLPGGCTWDLFRRRRTRMRRLGRTWHVGEPVEEGSSLRDPIPPGECELRPIGTSRAGGQRGSEWDAVRKTRCRSHVGATGDMGQAKKQGAENNVSHRFLVLFFFVHSAARWSQRC